MGEEKVGAFIIKGDRDIGTSAQACIAVAGGLEAGVRRGSGEDHNLGEEVKSLLEPEEVRTGALGVVGGGDGDGAKLRKLLATRELLGETITEVAPV